MVNEKFLKRPIPDLKYLRKIKWDIHSPRFKEAQLSLGFQDSEVVLRPIAFFQEEEYADKKIVQFRYQHHLSKLLGTLNEIIE